MAESPFWRLLRDFARPHWPRYLAGGLALLATNYLGVSIPLQIGAAIDALGEPPVAVQHVVAIAAMGVAVIVVRTLSRVWMFNPGRDVEYGLRRDLFARLMAQQPSFYAHRTPGDVVNRATNDVGFVRALIGYGVMQVLNVSFAVVLTGWRMLTLSWLLTLGVVVPVLVGMLVVRWGTGGIFRLHRKAQAELGDVNDHVLASLQGIATIQGFTAERAFDARFEERNQVLFRTRMRMSLVGSIAFPALYLSGGIALFLVIYVGGPMAIRGELSVGDVAAFATLVGVLLPPLRSLGWMLSIVQQGRASLERIFELVDEPVEQPERVHGPLEPTWTGMGPGFRVAGLSFAYPDAPDVAVLRDIDLDLPPGVVVGVFGRTGSGKSTLLRVLARLYNPAAGTVFAVGERGEVDVTRLNLDRWRQRMAVAPQRPFLFSDTIAENVALQDDADPEAVARAVSRAALDADLEALPDGISTVVGERGIMLSGGQRQRVALTRALYRDADVIMLDDVLSAVDHQTEARLVATLSRLGDGRRGAPTIFVVSHRLSALRHADVIVVMEDGRVVDRGTHEELTAREGVYRETWLAQAKNGSTPRERAL